MLADKDNNALRFASEHPFSARYAIWILPVVFLLFSGLQLNTVGQIAEAIDLSLTEIVQLWFSGVVPGEHYSGAVITAILRVERALSMFCFAIAFSGLAAAVSIYRGREQRLSALLAKQSR